MSEHTVEGYFSVFNLVESKNSLVGFWCLKGFIGEYIHKNVIVQPEGSMRLIIGF